MKEKILYIYNVVLGLLAVAVLFIGSIFWLGTQEDHERAIADNPLGFFGGRLLMSLVISLALTILIFGINYLYKVISKLSLAPRSLVKISLIEFLIFIAASISFVILGMYA